MRHKIKCPACGSWLEDGCDCDVGSQVHRYLQFITETMKLIPRFGIPMPNGTDPYLERFILERGTTYLHVIYGSDGDRDPHCHPFDFVSTIIHGSYVETAYVRFCESCDRRDGRDLLFCTTCAKPLSCVESGVKAYYPGSKNKKAAHELHRLTVQDGPVVTLVERGPKIREWGFMTPTGWQHHAAYIAEKFPNAQPTEVD